MIKEIYIRPESDPNFDGELLEFSDETESILTQLRVVLGTSPGEVLGEYTLGVEIENAVFNTKRAAQDVVKDINTQIGNYVYPGPNTSVSCTVDFGDSGKGYDYAVIDIYINGKRSMGVLVDKK